VNQVFLGILTEETHTNETRAPREEVEVEGPRGGVWWKSKGAAPNRVKRSVVEASQPGVSWPVAAKPKSVGRAGVETPASV
jgi:hypothetical protein